MDGIQILYDNDEEESTGKAPHLLGSGTTGCVVSPALGSLGSPDDNASPVLPPPPSGSPPSSSSSLPWVTKVFFGPRDHMLRTEVHNVRLTRLADPDSAFTLPYREGTVSQQQYESIMGPARRTHVFSLDPAPTLPLAIPPRCTVVSRGSVAVHSHLQRSSSAYLASPWAITHMLLLPPSSDGNGNPPPEHVTVVRVLGRRLTETSRPPAGAVRWVAEKTFRFELPGRPRTSLTGEILRIRPVDVAMEAGDVGGLFTYGCDLWVHHAPVLRVLHYPDGGPCIDRQPASVRTFAAVAPAFLPLFRGVHALSTLTTPDEPLGFVHRDLKASNVLASGRMIDFGLLTGLSRLYRPAGSPHIFDYFLEPPELGVAVPSQAARAHANLDRMLAELEKRVRPANRALARPLLAAWHRTQRRSLASMLLAQPFFSDDQLRTFDVYQLGQLVVQCAMQYGDEDEWRDGGLAATATAWALAHAMAADPRGRPPALACAARLADLLGKEEDLGTKSENRELHGPVAQTLGGARTPPPDRADGGKRCRIEQSSL